MPGLMSPHVTPDGRRIMLESDVLDIDRRVKEGDGTIGWAGDPGMWLELDRVRNVFIVCRYDHDTGTTVDVTFYPPPLDAGLLIKLRDGDIRREGNDPFAEMVAAEEKADADAAQAFDEQVEEDAAPRLVHEMKKAGVDIPTSNPVFFPSSLNNDNSALGPYDHIA